MRERGTGSYRKRRAGGYQVRYWWRGKQWSASVAKVLRIPASEQTEAHAKKALRVLRDRIGAGRYTPLDDRATVAAVLDAYVANRRLERVSKIKDIEKVAAMLKAEWAGCRAMAVTLPSLERWVLRRREDYKDGTIVWHLAYLRAAFKLAKRQGIVSVVPDFPQIRVDNARVGVVEPHEYTAILAYLKPPVSQIVTFLYNSGWRPTEVMGLLWADVNRTAGVITLPGARHKNRRPKALPIEGEIARVIAERWEARKVTTAAGESLAESVFHRAGRPVRNFDKVWKSACRAAGISRLIYDLKRSVIRDQEMAGIPRSVGKANTGHRSDAMYERYAIMKTKEQGAALVRLAEYRTEQGQSEARA